MKRSLVWLQLLIGWLPIWALFAVLIMTAHANTRAIDAILIAARNIVAAMLLSVPVWRLSGRLPWPHPFRLHFLLRHLGAAVLYSAAWVLMNSVIESVLRGEVMFVVGYGVGPYLAMGVWLYVMVAGVTYAMQAAERAAKAEALASRSQLAALRAQLHPHFLFNALHSVVQLIPREPGRAADAAEQLGALLRGTIEEDRDLIPLGEEWAFVERYLDIERIRFGDRLAVETDIPRETDAILVPSFALLTLVENAIRHGVEPSVGATVVCVGAFVSRNALEITVRDNGEGGGVPPTPGTIDGTDDGDRGEKTGLRRLRERLRALYGSAARLDAAAGPAGGFTATMVVPRDADVDYVSRR